MDDNFAKEDHKVKVSTHIRTSFIFALAEFERIFGDLWGHEIEDKNDLTREEYNFYKKYRELRKAVLDNGNNQIRLAETEIDRLYVSKHKFIGRTIDE